MTALQRLHSQRSQGEVLLRVERHGLARMREVGAAKVRFPHGGRDAILINTGGGLAGGDQFRYSIAAGEEAQLTVTAQAAERVYRTLGPAASVKTTLSAAKNAQLMWLPNETIFYDGAALTRELHADVASSAILLAVETDVFGRTAMGEVVRSISLKERWRIRRDGRLVFADDFVIEGALPSSSATLGDARAMAIVVLVAEDAESRLDSVRAAIANRDGASAWNGKLVARLLARDGFELRKALVPALAALVGEASLPKVWSM